MEMTEDISKKYILPTQKEAFLCCAKCCDKVGDMQDLQSW